MKRSILTASGVLGSVGAALAQESNVLPGYASVLPGQPHPWQITLQEALSPIEQQIHWFSDYTLAFIIPITILVAALLAYCVWKFRESKNPVPSRTAHNTTIEVIWTLAPVIVLLFIAIPSFQLLTAQYNPPRDPELTVKVTGYQWYWGYEYQPNATSPEAQAKQVAFESYPLSMDEREGEKTDLNKYPRLLAVDNELVVPVDTVIRIVTTSSDVIHSFALPSMGVKVDAVPGRLNEYWMEPLREGIFYGQCSELCGSHHYDMPIGLRVVSKEQFANWYQNAGGDLSSANEQLTAEIQKADAQVAVAAAQN